MTEKIDTVFDESCANKSWVELIEEDEEDFQLVKDKNDDIEFKNVLKQQQTPEKSVVISEQLWSRRNQSNNVNLDEDSLASLNEGLYGEKVSNTEDESCDNILIKDSLKGDIESTKPNLSYAQVVSLGNKDIPIGDTVSSKGNLKANNEDLSLTGHLDLFHVNTPCKQIDDGLMTPILDIMCEDTMFTPLKKEVESSPKKQSNVSSATDSKTGERSGKKRPIFYGNINEDDTFSPCKVSKHLAQGDVHNKYNTRTTSKRRHFEMFSKEELSGDNHKTRNTATSRRARNSGEQNGHYIQSPSKTDQYETDPEVLARRQKQIDYGKNTVGYDRYMQLIPKNKREKSHPKTPPKHIKYSRRAWDGLIKSWRLRLHKYDPDQQNDNGTESVCTDSDQYGSHETLSGGDSCSVHSTLSSPKNIKRQRKKTDQSEEEFL